MEGRQYLRQPLDRRYRPKNAYVLYNAKAGQEEEQFLDDCNQTMDTLLVFAGLFSAVTTGLIIETYKDLKPEPELQTEKLLQAIFMRQGDPSGQYNAITRDPFSPSEPAVITNALFFTSLSFSLFAALGAILVKQWTRKVFLSIKRQSSPRDRAREHFQKRQGIDDWGIPETIALIPMLLHIALGCFFAGLIVWLRSLNRTLYIIITVISGIALLFYITAAIIPSFERNAPFRWPVSLFVSSVVDLFPTREKPGSLPIILRTALIMRPANVPVMSTPIGRPDLSTELARERVLDEVDLRVFSNILHQPENVVETEAVADALRSRLIAANPRFGSALPEFYSILQQMIEIANASKVYQGGAYDIRPGAPLERVTTIAQFIEVALQTVDIDMDPKNQFALRSFLDLAELMLERAKYIRSATEIALYASIVVRLHRRFGKWHHLENASDTLSVLKEIGPPPRTAQDSRESTKDESKDDGSLDAVKPKEWSFQELYQWQQMISPYILSLTYLVLERYPLGDKEPVDEWFEQLTEDALDALQCAQYPYNSGRKDSYPLLRDALESIWMSSTQPSPRFLHWISHVMPVTLSIPVVSEDGSHRVDRSRVSKPRPISQVVYGHDDEKKDDRSLLRVTGWKGLRTRTSSSAGGSFQKGHRDHPIAHRDKTEDSFRTISETCDSGSLSTTA
ncbi:hypothetical protein FRC19_003553 [Serendipita sp. 401]|nr:hypothetical protein FRC19_003553 [Serendipita sp. 401]KAG9053251.1 hypothetical protein FS842_008459 [Serendipita sp. 407]